MNWTKLNRKASWVVCAAISLLLASQQHALRRARANERSAGEQVVRLSLENSAMRQAAERMINENNLWLEEFNK